MGVSAQRPRSEGVQQSKDGDPNSQQHFQPASGQHGRQASDPRLQEGVGGDTACYHGPSRQEAACGEREHPCLQREAQRSADQVAARRMIGTNPVTVTAGPMETELSLPALPPGVKDIDAEDGDNPQLCSEYARDTFVYLRQLERRGAVRPDCLAGCPTNDKMRAVLVDWLVEVQIQFKLLQETLFTTVDTIDRFLALEGRSISRAKLQLVGVSAMFLVSKIEEVYAPAISDFVYITDNAYTETEIRQMELRIIRALKFDLCQPIPLNFLRRYSKAGEVDVLQHSLAKYVLEVSLLDYRLIQVPGSLLAASALCLSLLCLDRSCEVKSVWTPTLEHYSQYDTTAVLELVPKLALNMVKLNKQGCKLTAVKSKYKSGKFLKVADLEEVKGGRIMELAGEKDN